MKNSPVTRNLSAAADSSLSPCPVFIAGEWKEISGLETSPVYNPSRGEIISEVPQCGADVVNDAVNAAADAFPAWRDTPPVERARLFFRYRQLVEENFDRICEMVAREHGKTLAEARGSAYRGLENIEYACGIPTLLMGDTLENIALLHSTSRQWYRFGCSRSRSLAETLSSSSRARKSR